MRVIIRISRRAKSAIPGDGATEPSPSRVDLRAVWCPGCGSRYVKTSRSRGMLDLAWSAFGYAAFRCLTCGRRFHFRAPQS